MRKGSFNGSDTERVTNRTMTVASNYKCTHLFTQSKTSNVSIPSLGRYLTETISKYPCVSERRTCLIKSLILSKTESRPIVINCMKIMIKTKRPFSNKSNKSKPICSVKMPSTKAFKMLSRKNLTMISSSLNFRQNKKN